jgi:hypothetical protein
MSDTEKWPLARVRAYRGFCISVRCGQGCRRPRDGYFAYRPGTTGKALRAPYLYSIRALIREAV